MSLDVASKIQDALRSAARGGATTPYTCPICNEPSNAGFKLWEHAKQAHPYSSEVTGYTVEAEAKDLFLAKAYVDLLTTKLHRPTLRGCSLGSLGLPHLKSDLLTLCQAGRTRPTRLQIAGPYRSRRQTAN